MDLRREQLEQGLAPVEDARGIASFHEGAGGLGDQAVGLRAEFAAQRHREGARTDGGGRVAQGQAEAGAGAQDRLEPVSGRQQRGGSDDAGGLVEQELAVAVPELRGAGQKHRVGHPFTAPAETPDTSLRWMIRKKITTGREKITVPAI